MACLNIIFFFEKKASGRHGNDSVFGCQGGRQAINLTKCRFKANIWDQPTKTFVALFALLGWEANAANLAGDEQFDMRLKVFMGITGLLRQASLDHSFEDAFKKQCKLAVSP